MKKPFVIKSDVEFLIVGPILKSHGIVVHSESVSINLISYAKLLYDSDESSYFLKSLARFSKYDVHYEWSDPISLKNFSRKHKFLLCYKNNELYKETSISDASLTNLISDVFLDQMGKHSVKRQFDRFTIDACETLNSYTSVPNLDNYENEAANILWTISPLLVSCNNPRI